MENKKIYLVVSGEYSDYGVDGVFDDKALAQDFIRSFSKSEWSDDDMRIKEVPLNPHENDLKEGYSPYYVCMDKEGKVVYCELSNRAYNHKESNKIQFNYEDDLVSYVFAKDEKHAIKITNEKRFKLLALDRWGNEAIEHIRKILKS